MDFHHLNAITLKGVCTLPIIDELLDELAGSNWFSKLDLKAGYHQIRLIEEDKEKTACHTHLGHFQFRVMSNGLTFAPGTFQTAVHTVLGPLLRHSVLVFMDDILVHTETYTDHLCLLRQVLQQLQDYELVAKRSKCSFGQTHITYLGHHISEQGMSTMTEHI